MICARTECPKQEKSVLGPRFSGHVRCTDQKLRAGSKFACMLIGISIWPKYAMFPFSLFNRITIFFYFELSFFSPFHRVN